MRLLVYAFEPYSDNKQNISQEVLVRIGGKDINKIVLPVEFESSSLISAVEELNPRAILGLGQFPRGQKIRIERRAKNSMGSKQRLATKITKDGPTTVPVTLKLKPDAASRLSYDAGQFVCNHTMYSLLTNQKTKDLQFAFIHIPKNFDLSAATNFVKTKINEITLAS